MNPPTSGIQLWRSGITYRAVLLLLGLIMAGGYLIFRNFILVVKPAPQIYGLWILSLTAGVAGFFSPCAFPLLPSYFALAPSEAARDHDSGVSSGLMVALGVVTFDMLLGLLIAVLGAGVGRGLSISATQANTGVLFFRGAVGIILFTLGIMQLKEVNLKPRLVDAFTYRVRSSYQETTRKSPTHYYLYGLGYTAAGMGCTGPILAGLIVYALGSGGFTSALLAFLIFSGTMAALMLVISFIVGRSSERVVKRLKGASPGIKRLSAVILMGVGAFTTLSTVFLADFVRMLFP